MAASRFVVGIDLGTTNSGAAYVDTGAAEADGRSLDLPIPQVVGPNTVADRLLLPSYLYLPGPSEVAAGSLKLPWDANRDYAVGEFARQYGALAPTRLVSSAKSWLCHPGVDRKGPILPWKG
ncbi:MAG TPA: Hsp70 family protein, partial [Gemmataceae bacterium]|nr:Hsp70 family protein [Gemmataceae bacterium]